MVKQLRFKMLLLLCALVVGTSNVWAEKTGELTFTSKTTPVNDSQGKSWDITSVGQSSYGYENGYLKVGTGSSPATSLTVTTSGYSSVTITKVQVWATSKANTNVSAKVYIGNTLIGTSSVYTSQNASSGGTEFSVENTNNYSGNVKVEISRPSSADGAIYLNKVIVTYEEDTRASAELAWTAASAEVTYGNAQNDFPTLTNPHNVSVSYESSEEDVATINNSGVITVKNVTGETTITAVFEGNEEYQPQTVSYTLTVNEGPYEIIDGVFDFVKAGSANPVVHYGSGVTPSTSSTYITESKTWTAGNVTMVTAKSSGNGYRWWGNDYTLRFYNGSYATFSVPSDYVITKIVTTGANFDTADKGTLSGATWTGAENEVTLSVTNTRNIKTITVTYGPSYTQEVQSYGWASHVTPAPVEFAAGDAYVVIAASVAAGLTLEEVTEAPAGTPVLLKGAGTKTITVVASATAPATNLLSVCDGTIEDDKYAYVLAKYGTGACFKQWTGAASALNGRVVLLLDEQVASRSSFDLDGSAAGISLTENGSVNNDNSFYNLSGQRVAQPTKGLYIVNGKKVLMK